MNGKNIYRISIYNFNGVFPPPARWGSLDFIGVISSVLPSFLPSFLPPPSPNSELQISVSTAGPQPWTPDCSGQCQCQRECQNRCQIEYQNVRVIRMCQKECQIEYQNVYLYIYTVYMYSIYYTDTSRWYVRNRSWPLIGKTQNDEAGKAIISWTFMNHHQSEFIGYKHHFWDVKPEQTECNKSHIYHTNQTGSTLSLPSGKRLHNDLENHHAING